ncbi:TonB-dependent receptor domain-containing protein [Phocaeicola oris]|uniref:TonB-dependent receptor domain-containing protein n=1 Tax=Phocaeicola oris TaxID=2896850 RepID=UPI00234EFA14|nr:TonB-dependent receptor [Phocaeicola oris]MCE2616606.1 TonB-dependent receptor [Phocaeicola oris]
MKNLKVLFTLAMLMLVQSVFAQKTVVKGVLLDSLTNEGEPYATIRIFKGKDTTTPIAMSVTDLEGTFNQPVSGKGSFIIFFSSVGKESVTRNFELNGQATLDLGTLYMKDDMRQLQEVEVVAQKPLVKMEVDKMSYDVSNDVDAKSNTVLEMLRKVPMVTVDGQDNITVNGSSSFKVYVDGKPNVMMSSNPSQIFKSMPANIVKNIEVVTNPGAKYDAEGVGGVLNLILNKQNGMAQQSMDGYNGTVRAMIGTRGYVGSGYVSAQQGKVSLSANMLYSHNKMNDMTVDMNRIQHDDNGKSIMEYAQKLNMKNNFAMGNISLGWDIDSISNLGISASITDFDNRNEDGLAGTRMSGGIYGNGFGYSSKENSKMRNTSFNGSIDYQRYLGRKDRSMTLSYMYTTTPQRTKSYSVFDEEGNTYLDLTDRYSNSRNRTQEHIGQIDFVTPLGKGQTLDFGAKYTSHTSSSKSLYYLGTDPQYTYNEKGSMFYKHNDGILAGYAEYAGQFGKVGFKSGLRYEHTWQDVKYVFGSGSDFTKNYGNLVPSANLQYTISQTSNLGLTYNMRISRPGISYLNPYVDRTNPTSLTYGNPDLEVEKAHNINMVYNLFSNKFMMNLSFRQSFCNNAIEQYNFYQDNLLNTTYGNIVKNRQTGLNSYVNWSLTKNTRILFNGGVSYVDLQSKVLDTRNHGWQANAMVGVQQTLPAKIQLSVNAMSNTKSYTLQGYRSGFNILSATVNKSFCKDKLNVSVIGVTPFFGKLNIKNYSKGKNFETTQKVSVPVNAVLLNVSWSFGNTKHRAKQIKSNISNDDYIEHQSESEQINNISGN